VGGNLKAMISHAHSAIFVHIPKTGGQSIAQIFLRLCGRTWKAAADGAEPRSCQKGQKVSRI